MAIRHFDINTSDPLPFVDLVVNAAQSNAPTPVIVKAGNFKINCDIGVTTGNSGTIQLVAAVLYKPEGVSIANNAALGEYMAQHPEYILVWRQFDAAYGISGNNATQQVTMSSRLKRNLNSGDKIIFAILNADSGAPVNNIRAMLTAQYWTCAN